MGFWDSLINSTVATANPQYYAAIQREAAYKEEMRQAAERAAYLQHIMGKEPTGGSIVNTYKRIRAQQNQPPIPPQQNQPPISQSLGTPYDDMFNLAAAKYGADPRAGAIIGKMESNYDPYAVSPTGPQGVMQLGKAAAIDAGIDPAKRFDPLTNIMGGVNYYMQMLKRFGPEKAAMAYYDGPTATAAGRNSDAGRAYQDKFNAAMQSEQPLMNPAKIDANDRDIQQTQNMVADAGITVNDSGNPQYPGSNFAANPAQGGEGILGNDMDPVRRSFGQAIQALLKSNDPMLQEQGLAMFQEYQNAFLKDIERTSLQKNLTETGAPPGSQDRMQLARENLLKGGQNININTGAESELDKPIPANVIPTLRGADGQPINIAYGTSPRQLQEKYPGAFIASKGDTESESKNAFFGQSAMDMMPIIAGSEKEASRLSVEVANVLQGIPIVGPGFNIIFKHGWDDKTKELAWAAANFVAAVNYKQTGAQITPPEWQNAFERFIPMSTDSAKILAWKAENRANRIKDMLKQGGPEAAARVKELDTFKANSSISQEPAIPQDWELYPEN